FTWTMNWSFFPPMALACRMTRSGFGAFFCSIGAGVGVAGCGWTRIWATAAWLEATAMTAARMRAILRTAGTPTNWCPGTVGLSDLQVLSRSRFPRFNEIAGREASAPFGAAPRFWPLVSLRGRGYEKRP